MTVERSPQIQKLIDEEARLSQKSCVPMEVVRQRRIKLGILAAWEDWLAIKQSRVPAAIKKITDGKLSDAAVMVLWMSPPPTTEIQPTEGKKY